MDSQILYLIIGVLVGAIAIYFFVKKNSSSEDNRVLSSQLADLIVRFSKVEEATKNISSTQASIDNTFKSFEGMLNDRQERGAFSEMELEKLLKDRLPSQYLKFQHTLSNNKRVDCLIDLGENSQKIGIDSKFVLDNYKYLRSAKTEEEIKKYKKLFEDDVVNNIKKISSDYIITGETTPHAIMFIRSEAVYREISESNLITKGLEKNVLIVSPSLLWGLLNTLRMFLKDSEMSKKAQVVIKEIGIIGKDIGRLVERVTEVETKFNNVAEQFRGIKISADKIQSRAEKIQELESKDEITK
jgi:DNA recombination protein RmuC